MYYMYVKKSCRIDQSLSLNEFIRLELCQINFKEFFFSNKAKKVQSGCSLGITNWRILCVLCRNLRIMFSSL